MMILVVDDLEDVRMILAASLENAGYAVELATNGAEALELIRRSRPSLIVSDILMPEMDGFALCRAVMSDEEMRTIPFVFYTATYVGTQDEKLAMALGASRLLVKPMEVDEFLKAIEEVLREHGKQRLPVPELSTKAEQELERMYNGVLTRKLDGKVRELEEKRLALHESEEHKQRLLMSTGEAMYGLDRRGQCTFANAECLRMLGYREEEDLLRQSMHSLIHHTRPDGSPYPVEECEIYQALREAESIHVDEELLWRKDGTSFVAECWSYPIRRDQQVVGSVVTFLSITERNQAEKALLRLNRALATIKKYNDVLLHGTDESAAQGKHQVQIPVSIKHGELPRSIVSLLREPETTRSETQHARDSSIARTFLGNSRSRAHVSEHADSKTLKDRDEETVHHLRGEVPLAPGFDSIVAESPAFRRCLHMVEKVAPTDATVLVLGETGTGKELVARAIHDLSGRRDKPLVTVNCAALPANLIESELFGHEKGAFTGAMTLRRGRFELAHGGSLFLDEIGDLPLELQSKLLRVLQEGEFERVGGTKVIQVDVRIVAATNRHLEQAVADGEFRADLYYRLNIFPISLPPLRERGEDIEPLAEYFIRKHASQLGREIESISGRMLSRLRAYSWPGNVREFENTIERVLISSDGPVLDIPLSHEAGSAAPRSGVEPDGEDLMTLESAERAHIQGILDRTGWTIEGRTGAAAILGVPASTLRSKMKKLGIVRSRDAGASG